MAKDPLLVPRDSEGLSRTNDSNAAQLSEDSSWVMSLAHVMRSTPNVCQAWGGQLGLRLLAADPVRFRRVVAANALFPTGDFDLGEAFQEWADYSQRVPELPVGSIIQTAAVTELLPDVLTTYDAPFPTSHTRPARDIPTARSRPTRCARRGR